MRSSTLVVLAAALAATGTIVLSQSRDGTSAQTAERLWHHRNLGKALYENPTTKQQAVGELKSALDLDPSSARDRLNYGLALLRAGKTDEGVAELERVQRDAPEIPHTWFNLGIAYKKDAQYEKAAAQFEQMVTLVPDEPISHYNLGYLYKLLKKPGEAQREFERARDLDPNLAGPHFQLYNAYRDAGRTADADREQQVFQQIKRRQVGAAIPEDLEWNVYAELLDTLDPGLAADPPAPPRPSFAGTALGGGFAGPDAGVLVVDVDADRRADVAAWGRGGVRVFVNGDTPQTDGALTDLADVRSVAAGDRDNDGFPDLCVVTPEGAFLYANQAGAFTTAPTPLATGHFARALWVDYDHDYDVDLLLVGEDSALLRNNGPAGFSDQTSEFPFVAGRAVDAAVFTLINDTSGHDIAVSYSDRGGVVYRDLLFGKYRADETDALPRNARSFVAQDVDHDGWVDLVAATPAGVVTLLNRDGNLAATVVGGDSGGARATAVIDVDNRGVSDLLVNGSLHRNLGRGAFGLPYGSVIDEAVALAVTDFDNDGREDVAAVDATGTLHRLRNTLGSPHHYLRLSLDGVRNPKLAPEAQVEVRAGVRYQKRTYTGTPLVFGLRGATTIDAVRVTWPNGLIQNELRQAVDRSVTYREAQRLSGSCPMIFTWDGSRFQFVTDVLGVAPLGASSGDGTYFPLDHDEYVQVPGDALALAGDAYEVRITEELREVSYLDHPADVRVFTNDKFKAPPFPEFRLFGGRSPVHPVAAHDGEGRDVRARLLAKDRAYVDTFARDYAGVAELHDLVLDFGGAAPDNRAVLVLDGWVDWADASTFVGLSQEGRGGLVFPSIQVKDASGRWVTVVDDMGIPAGKPKTIAVDLTGRFLSASREVRIVTNLCLYFDEISLLDDASPPPHVLTPLPAPTADLRFRGFSTPVIHPARTQPERFDYDRPMPVSMWNQTPGLYTRYGDVATLVSGVDDRLVIMGSGDELRLRFPAGGLPPLAAGWTRDFLLHVDGWAKDGDPNTAFASSVEPLPFHGMTAYPYAPGERYPDDAAHREYRAAFNIRPALRLLQPLTASARGR